MDGWMTSSDVKMPRLAAAVHLCHLLSQREQEQKEVGEGECAVLQCHLKFACSKVGWKCLAALASVKITLLFRSLFDKFVSA